MPTSINVAAFVLGAILVLIALLGGGFRIFGAEIPSRVSRGQRIASGCLAFMFFGAALSISLWPASDASSPPLVEDSPGDGQPDQEDLLPPVEQDPPPQDPPDPPPPIEQASEVRESSGFEIAFFGCKTAGNETICSFKILNKMQDRNLTISGAGIRNGAGVMISSYSRMIGPDGVEYRASWVEAGNKRGNVRVDHLFYSGVPTRTKIAFVGLPTDLSMAAILVVHFGRSPMQFKDVAIG